MDTIRTLNVPQAPSGDEPTQVLDTEVEALLNRFSERQEASAQKVADAAQARHDEVVERMDAIDIRIGDIEKVSDNADDDPCLGYKAHCDFLVDVKNAAFGQYTDGIKRVANAAGSDEQATFTNPEGGFLIPEGFLKDLLTIDPFAIQEDTGARTRNIPMATSSVQIPVRVDKDHTDSVTGGFRMYRTAEANSVLNSLQSYEKLTLQVNDLMGLAYATDRMLEDSPMSMASIIQAGFTTEYRSRLNNERLRGTGNGQYLGYFESPCKIEVDKESGQAADTIVGLNLIKMKARAWKYSECVWMATHAAMVQLYQAHISGNNTDYFFHYAGNGTAAPESLLGRPIVYDENMSALGDVGDIALINWNEYLEGTKGNGTFASSIHVRFLTNETCYKFLVRNDGTPWWRSAMQPKNGGDTLSPCIVLAERA